MRYGLRVLYCSVSVFAFFSGCGGPASNKAAEGPALRSEAKKGFDAYLAGTWQAEGGVWKIVLTPDGEVNSVLVPMGETEVRPNQTTEYEMQDGSFSHITAGECLAEYNPADRVLFVSIELKDIYISFPGDSLTGNSLDIFRGPVSRDGKTWNAEWTNIFDYGPRFPQDENDINNPQPLVFKKVAEKPKVADSNVTH
jgi:hypothetical protein